MKSVAMLAIVVLLVSITPSTAAPKCSVKCGNKCCKAPDNAIPACMSGQCAYNCKPGFFKCMGVCFKVPEHATPTCKNGHEFKFTCSSDYPVACENKLCCPPIDPTRAFVTCPGKKGCTLNCKKGFYLCQGSCWKLPATPCTPWCGRFSPMSGKPTVGCDCPKGFTVAAGLQSCVKAASRAGLGPEKHVKDTQG